MSRCPQCGGYLQLIRSSWIRRRVPLPCVRMDAVRSTFQVRADEVLSHAAVNRRIEWRKQNPGYDLYAPRSAASQLKVSVSLLRYFVRHDSAAPVIVGAA